jgi:SAM-dependent methyltransferase
VDTGNPARSSAEELRPPEELVYVGGGDFVRVGQKFVNYLVSHGGLQPDASVLDVGCGIGRMAVALTGHLSPDTRYEGFDVVPEGIQWCTEQVTPRYPNFRFRLADIHNSRYNPAGALRAREFEFPYDADQFDFVFLSSVFTHMLPDGVEHYVSEIARVTKPHGRCLATFFLLNDVSLACLKAGESRLSFDHDYGIYRVRREETPEGVVAYQEDHVMELFRRHGFTPRQPDYGRWAGPTRSSTNNVWQDVVIADLV